jgi:hypothetical protein
VEPSHRIGEDLLGQILGAVVIARPAADVAIDVRVVAAERTLGNVIHTRLFEQPARK